MIRPRPPTRLPAPRGPSRPAATLSEADPVIARASELAGFNFWSCGPKTAMVQITAGNKPAGVTLGAGVLQIFGTADVVIDGYILDGYWIEVIGALVSNIPNTITIRNCKLDFRTIPGGLGAYALRQDRGVQGPKLIIENCLFDGGRDGSRQLQIYLQGNNFEFRYNRIKDTPFDCLALGGWGVVEYNHIGPGGFRFVDHCDLIPIYATFGLTRVQWNLLDHRNITREIQPSPVDQVWPLNNALRITPNTQTDIQFPVIVQNNFFASASYRSDVTNGWLMQDARATDAEPGCQFLGNWADPKFNSVNGAGGSWGPVFKAAGVITEPAPTVHQNWRGLWDGVAIGGTTAPDKNVPVVGMPGHVASILAAMTVQPDTTRKNLIGAWVQAWEDAGIWPLCFGLKVFAAHDAQAMLVDWAMPVSTKLATLTGSPTQTVNRGITTNGTSSLINTSIVPNTLKPNDITLAYWSRTAGVTAGSSGASFSNNTFGLSLTSRFTGDLMRIRLGNSNPVTVANTDGSGLAAATRVDDSNISAWRNGVQLGGNIAHAPNLDIVQHQQITLGRQGVSSFSWEAREYSMIGFFRKLTPAQMLAMYNGANPYMTAVFAL